MDMNILEKAKERGRVPQANDAKPIQRDMRATATTIFIYARHDA
jgi:hypothetical protein